jgi:hypothetical protein
VTAPSSNTYRGWYFDRDNSQLDVYFGLGGASDPQELLRLDAGTIDFSSAHSGNVKSLVVTNTSNDTGAGSLIQVEAGGSSATLDAIFNALETSGHTLSLGIDTSASLGVLAMNSALGSTDGDAIRITDATPPVVTYNATHPTGTFDYVCESCGEHGGDSFVCHGEVAKWHDDVASLIPVLEGMKGGRITGYEPAVQHLAKIGVMEVTPSDFPGEEGKNFVGIRLSSAQWFTWSAMKQLYQKIERLEQRLVTVEA